MRKVLSKTSAVIGALLLAACATVGPTTYGPADSKGFGYSEQKIEDGRYRITYGGSGGMSPAQVDDYALLRAAELTVANGFDWFRVVGSNVTGEERGGVGLGAGVGGGSYGRSTGVGVSVGGNLGTIGGQEYYTVRMEVLMGSGEPPELDEVYDARDVIANIGGGAA